MKFAFWRVSRCLPPAGIVRAPAEKGVPPHTAEWIAGIVGRGRDRSAAEREGRGLRRRAVCDGGRFRFVHRGWKVGGNAFVTNILQFWKPPVSRENKIFNFFFSGFCFIAVQKIAVFLKVDYIAFFDIFRQGFKFKIHHIAVFTLKNSLVAFYSVNNKFFQAYSSLFIEVCPVLIVTPEPSVEMTTVPFSSVLYVSTPNSSSNFNVLLCGCP